MLAAALKRARKNARRLGLCEKEPMRPTSVCRWYGVIDGFLVDVDVEEFKFIAYNGEAPDCVYSWAIRYGGVTFASFIEHTRTKDEAELAALRAVPDAVERMAERVK